MRVLEFDDRLTIPAASALAFVSFSNGDGTGPCTLPAAALSASEARYAHGLRPGPRRAAWLAGRVAAKTAIGRLAPAGLLASGVEVLPAASGAPIVRLLDSCAPAPVDVSIAHTRGLAVALAFRRPETGAMGIDVEVLDQPIDPALVGFAFDADEAGFIRDAVDVRDRQVRLLGCWTAKEAVLKAMGRGLSVPLADVRLEQTGAAGYVRATVHPSQSKDVEFAVQYVGDRGHVYALAIEATAPGA